MEKTRYYIKKILKEIQKSIVLEIIWNILIFIPRMIIRLLKNIW